MREWNVDTKIVLEKVKSKRKQSNVNMRSEYMRSGYPYD